MEKANWIQCDSKNDLHARLEAVKGHVFDEFEADDSNAYGYLSFSNDAICIPLAFSDVGLVPESISSNEMIFIGITDNVVGYDLKTGSQIFVYRMPTVFHNFVAIQNSRIFIQDETGFVSLSVDGKQEGIKLYSDVIDTYQISGSIISGEIIDGELFQLSMADLK